MAEDKAIVEIGDESFSIVEVPSSTTAIVSKQKERLLGSIDLPALVTDLGRVGNFVRIAYNSVAGYTDLQIQICEIGVDVTKLCDKSAVTVLKFKQASGSILGDLQGTYQFLLDGLEDVALETLHAVTDVAKDMAAAADQLHQDFDENCKDDSELAEVAINALHSAMGGLQKFLAIMMKAALFWKQMQVHCEQLAKDKMQRMITSVMKKSEEQRLKVWTSNGFKTQAINHYAQWVALDNVCTIYMGRIQETENNLLPRRK